MHNNDRSIIKLQFLNNHIKDHYTIQPMVQDASFRTYDRIKTPNQTYVLMDSPPEHYSTLPFEKMSDWLNEHHFSAPKIYHRDSTNGFLLLEDFGDILLQQILPQNRKKYYLQTMDLLVTLHKTPTPNWLSYYSNEILLKELEIFTDYFLPYSNITISSEQKLEYLSLWTDILNKLPQISPVTLLRDYHVQNIMLLQNKNKIQSLGLLDFQDAMIGSPIYDIVSILEDAREEVDFAFAQEIFHYYLEQMPNIHPQDASNLYDILGAQRNLRILGVFARKKIKYGSDNYLHLIPRVNHYVQRDLNNTILEPIKNWHKNLNLT